MSAVTSARPHRLHFAAFVMNTTSHIIQGTWRRPTARQTDFNDLEHWVGLARTLEQAKFDAVFFADVVGVYAPYRGDALIRRLVGILVIAIGARYLWSGLG